jgi:hypothetical protein
MNANGINCPQCGALNPAGSQVCGNCGSSLLSVPQPPQQPYMPPMGQQPQAPPPPQYYPPQSSYVPPGAPVPPNMPPAGQYQPGMPPPGYGMPPQQPPKKSNRTWIACCAGLLVVALCVLVVGAFFALRRGTNLLGTRFNTVLTSVANSTGVPDFLGTAIPPSVLTTIEAITPENLLTTPTPASSSQNTPQASGNCSYTPPAITASGLISKVTMAKDTQGANKDPVNPATVFDPTATIHAVVALDKAPTNTRVKAIWFATNAVTVDCNTQVGQPYELTTDGTRNVDFTLSPNQSWPTGSYRVEIYINDNLDQVVDYTIQ